MAPTFEERLASLAQRVAVSVDNPDSGHLRWAVYAKAIATPEEWGELLYLVELEPDAAVASSVVVNILEVVPGESRMKYVLALPPGKAREYAKNRADELSIADTLVVEGGDSALTDWDIGGWPTWLQLRVATAAVNENVLESLLLGGSTKRVRLTADRRLKSLRGDGHRPP